MNAELLMLLGGCSAFVLTIFWVRSRELGERYALAWILVAFLLLLCGLFPRAIEALADASRLSYPAAVLFIALAAVYVFAFSVSVSLTRLQRLCVRLSQEVALLEHRLREMESTRAPHAGSQRGPIDAEGQPGSGRSAVTPEV
jgi:hypothetical protein